MKPVRDAAGVSHVDWLKFHVLEVETSAPRDFRVEAATAKVAVASFDRTVVDQVVVWDTGSAAVAHPIAHLHLRRKRPGDAGSLLIFAQGQAYLVAPFSDRRFGRAFFERIPPIEDTVHFQQPLEFAVS